MGENMSFYYSGVLLSEKDCQQNTTNGHRVCMHAFIQYLLLWKLCVAAI